MRSDEGEGEEWPVGVFPDSQSHLENAHCT
jgi:hypothetical protein